MDYDNKTRNESIIGAPEFFHAFFTNKHFPKDHPDQLYIDVLFDISLYILVAGGLVCAGILPGIIYVTVKVIVFSGRFILLLHYTSHNVSNKRLT